MKIIFYEMRKSWLKGFVFIVLAVVTVLDFIRAFPFDSYIRSMYYNYNKVFEVYGGPPDNGKLRDFGKKADNVSGAMTMGRTDIVSDDFFTENAAREDGLLNYTVKPQIEYVITYPNISNNVALKAYENYQLYDKIGRSYEKRENAMIYRIYSGRQVSELRGNQWAKRFFSHDFSSLACLIMLVLGLSGSFSTEKESGMKTIIGAYGKVKRTVASKMLSAMIFCALLTLWFTCADLLFYNIFDGFDGINLPLYSVQKFKYTPLNITILQGILLWTLQRFLSLLAMSAAVYLISELSPNTVIATVGGFLLCMVLVVLGGFQKNIFNPVSALTPDNFLVEFKAYNCFGFPVLQPIMLLIVLALESVFLSLILIMAEKAKRR